MIHKYSNYLHTYTYFIQLSVHFITNTSALRNKSKSLLKESAPGTEKE